MDRKDELKTYRDFYYGDLDGIYAHFRARRVSQDAKDNDTVIEKYRFVFRNFVRLLVKKLVIYLPDAFTLEAKPKGADKVDDDMGNEIMAWLEGPNFGGGKTFWEYLPGTYRSGYIYGTSYNVLYVKDGVVRVKRGYSENATIVVNPKDVSDVQMIVFEWDVEVEDGEGGKRTVKMRWEITKEEYRLIQDNTEAKTEKHEFKRIPVVILRHDEVEGSQYGESLVKGLLEAQQNINLVSTLRQYANKMNSFRIWSPKESTAEIKDGIKIRPGVLSRIPIEAVGGNVDLTSLENEIQDHIEEIHDLANVPMRRNIMSALGGQATATEINALLMDMNEAAKQYIMQCQKAFEEMCELYYLVQHEQEIDVTIDYPSMDQKDPEWQKWEANYLYQLGYYDESLRSIGYPDDKIDAMKKEKAESDARDQAAFDNEYEKSRIKDSRISGQEE